MSPTSLLQHPFRLICALFITVASIFLSITYFNSIPRYDFKPEDRRLLEKHEEVQVHEREGGAHFTTLQNHTFRCPLNSSRFQDVEIDIERSIPPIDELYHRLRIVTAISNNHYEEALPWIASIQKFMPEQIIILYNLGLNQIFLQKVKEFCNVQVREFPFSSYPDHVKNLHTYAWKPIIIDITLREFGAIFWGDSSIRLNSSLRNLIPISLKHHGYLTHFCAFDPKKTEEITHQYFFTHPTLYANLGVNRKEYYNSIDMAPHAAANRQFYLNSSYIQTNIVQPMLQCALEYRCISPVGARLGKHRYDASVLAILIYKNLRGEWTRSTNDNRAFDEVVYLEKSNVGKETVRTCS